MSAASCSLTRSALGLISISAAMLLVGCVATVRVAAPPPPPAAAYVAPPPPDVVEMQASEAPPPLPDYDQPPPPDDGYLWTPGYWPSGRVATTGSPAPGCSRHASVCCGPRATGAS